MKSYLITDPTYYTNNPKKFAKILQKAINLHHIDMACFRDKISTNQEDIAKVFVDICKKNNIKKYFINSDISLASKLDASGVHLTSKQFNQIKKAQELNLEVIISCHTQEDIKLAIEQNVNYVTYSPIFTTPNKGVPKGIKDLDYVTNRFSIPIIALGGIITKEHIKLIQSTKAYGFSSIRFFLA